MTHTTQESSILTISFMTKDTNEDQLNEVTYRKRSGRVPNAELLCPLSMKSGEIPHLAHQRVHPPGGCTELQCRVYTDVSLYGFDW